MKRTVEVVINAYKVDGQFLNDWTIELNVSRSALWALIKLVEKLSEFEDPSTPRMYIRFKKGIVS